MPSECAPTQWRAAMGLGLGLVGLAVQGGGCFDRPGELGQNTACFGEREPASRASPRLVSEGELCRPDHLPLVADSPDHQVDRLSGHVDPDAVAVRDERKRPA